MPLKGSKKCPKCGKYTVPPCKCDENINTTSTNSYVGLSADTNYHIKLDMDSLDNVNYDIRTEDGIISTGTSKINMEKKDCSDSIEFEIDKYENITKITVKDGSADCYYEEPKKKEKWWRRFLKWLKK